MKKLILSILILISIFSGCTNQKQLFNPNSKGILFVEGKPYRIPYGTKYYIFTKKYQILFQEQNFNKCSLNDILWYTNKIPKGRSAYGIVIPLIHQSSRANMTLIQLKELSQTLPSPMKENTIKLVDKLIKMTNETTTMGELKANPNIINYLQSSFWVSITIEKIKHGNAGCSSSMSSQEYNYFIENQKQQAQFKHEQSIQNQKSLDKSLDRLNDTINSMTPKTYNINHSGSVNVYHY